MKKWMWICEAVLTVIVLFIAAVFFFAEKTPAAINSRNVSFFEFSETLKEDVKEIRQQTDNAEALADAGMFFHVEIEAGTEALLPEYFFREYEGQELKINTDLSEAMLRSVGEQYPVNITYEGRVYTVELCIIDTTPPEILNAGDITAYLGDSISYKTGIELTDNSGGEISLEVDTSGVDAKKPGDYIVVYTATDESGNSSVLETVLHLNVRVVSEEMVEELADEVIADVITEDMSKWDQAYALFNWCRRNITYSSSMGDRSSVWTGAYEGLHDHYGDCYTYYATYSVLLTKCGISNLCVARVGGESNHWWNLVNVGDGWYHCDTSPRNNDHPYTCFMQTDEQIAAYTESYPEHPNYYTFDESLYPERETTIVFGN